MNDVNQRDLGKQDLRGPARLAALPEEDPRLKKEALRRSRDLERLQVESNATRAQVENLLDEAAAVAEARGIVHVVEDDEAFARGICRLLKAHAYAVCRYASAADFLLAQIADAPGCVLMDVYLPGPSGFELQSALAAGEILLPVIFMSGRAEVPMSVRAMKAGAIDFLEKPIDRETLVRVVRAAIARSIEQREIRERLRGWQECYDRLTKREMEVFQRVVNGKMNKEIAGELGAAERTIKAHRAQVMQKMRVSSVAELVRAAKQLGLGRGTGAQPSL